MSYQYGSLAVGGPQLLSDRQKYTCYGLFFGDRISFRVIQVNAGKLQRAWFNSGTSEGFDFRGYGFSNFDAAKVVHTQYARGDFQDGIGFRIKTTRFQVHNNW